MIGNGLLLINLLVIVLIGIINFSPSGILQIILGLPLVIFSPGYVLIAALFPKRDHLDGVERVALSFILSIVVVSLVAFILNFTPWGIRIESVLYSVTLFIFLTSTFAWLKLRRLPEPERFGIEFPGWVPHLSGRGWDRALSILLILSILGVFGTLGYTITNPKVGEKYTEFYILGLSGAATDYPDELTVWEEGEVIVVISNQEHGPVTYRVEVVIDGARNSGVGPVTLEYGEKWEEKVSFTPTRVGDNQKIEFLLYRQGQNEIYQKLHLWVDVIE